MSGIDLNAWNGVATQDDVVLLRSLKLDETQFRLRKMNAIDTLGVAKVSSVWFLDPPLTIHVMVGGEIHAVSIAVLEQRTVGTRIALPRCIGDQSHVASHRLVQLKSQRIAHRLDEVVVDQQLPPRADVDRFVCTQR